VNELVSVIEQLAVQVGFHESEHSLQQRVERFLVGSNGGNPELGSLKQIVVSHLGRGHFELVADPALEALDDHPLLLQAAATRKVQIEESVRNHHTRKT
jgi:hypothetical protein